jgi:hypothetical protein
MGKYIVPRTFAQLFVSELPNEEEQMMEGVMRKTKA